MCGVKETITDMAFNVAGVRDIARVLKISIIIITYHVFK
ncbi:IS1-like element transposase [Enterobacter sp. SA187]